MLERLKKLANNRAKILERIDKDIVSFLKSQARDLYEMFTDIIFGLEEDEDGFVRNNSKNRNIRSKENDVGFQNAVGSHISDNMEKIQKESEKYFDEFDSSEKSKQERLKAFNTLLSKYADKNVLKEKFSDGEVRRKTRLIMLRGVFQGKTKKQIQSRVKKYLIDDKNFEEIFTRAIGEIHAQFDRALHLEKAQRLGFRSAIYEGGLIKTSRDFCEERNSKVFTFSEILKFGTKDDDYGGYINEIGDFQGKTEIYDPFLDAGGYNCRHFYSFISDDLAIILRPELKEIYG